MQVCSVSYFIFSRLDAFVSSTKEEHFRKEDNRYTKRLLILHWALPVATSPWDPHWQVSPTSDVLIIDLWQQQQLRFIHEAAGKAEVSHLHAHHHHKLSSVSELDDIFVETRRAQLIRAVVFIWKDFWDLMNSASDKNTTAATENTHAFIHHNIFSSVCFADSLTVKHHPLKLI